MATYFVDGVSGSDANNGTSFATAFQTIAHLEATMVAGDTGIICATGTYTLAATVTWNTAGSLTNGPITVTGGNATGTVDGTLPLITSSTNSVALFTLVGGASGTLYPRFENLHMTHTAATRGDAFAVTTSGISSPVLFKNVLIDGCAWGFNCANHQATAGVRFENCTIQNCKSGGINNGTANPGDFIVGSLLLNNTGNAYSTNAQTTFLWVIDSIIAGCTGIALNDTGTTRVVCFTILDSVIANNGSDGIRLAENTGQFTLIAGNSIFYGNSGFAVNITTQPQIKSDTLKATYLNAYGGNGGGDLNGISYSENEPTSLADITGIGNPFTSSTNFALNSTAGAGLLLQGEGWPGAFLGGATTGFASVGPVQLQALTVINGLPGTIQMPNILL